MDEFAEGMRHRIAARLERLKLTPLTAASQAGLPRDTIRNLFRQEGSLPRADTLVKIAEALETTVGHLVGENKYDGSDIDEEATVRAAELAIQTAKPIGVWCRAGNVEPIPWPGVAANFIDLIFMNVPGFESDALFAVEVGDSSMDMFYHKDRYLICANMDVVGARNGDHVVYIKKMEDGYIFLIRELVFVKRENFPGFVTGLIALTSEENKYPDIVLDEDENPGRVVGVVVADLLFHNRPAENGFYGRFAHPDWGRRGKKATT